MKQAELTAAFNAGKIITVARFLHFKKEVIPYRSRVDGKAATFNKVQYTVMTANGVVFVEPDTRQIPGFNMETFKCPFVDNEKIVVEITGMSTEKGVTTITGNVEKLD